MIDRVKAARERLAACYSDAYDRARNGLATPPLPRRTIDAIAAVRGWLDGTADRRRSLQAEADAVASILEADGGRRA